jgi:hypothetical protein
MAKTRYQIHIPNQGSCHTPHTSTSHITYGFKSFAQMAFCVDLPPWIHFSDAELDVVDVVSLILNVPLWWGRRQATLVHVHDMSVRFVRYDLRHPHLGFQTVQPYFHNTHGGVALLEPNGFYKTWHGCSGVESVLNDRRLVVGPRPRTADNKEGIHHTILPERALLYARGVLLGNNYWRCMFQLEVHSSNSCKQWQYTKTDVVDSAITIDALLLGPRSDMSDIDRCHRGTL